MTQHNKISCSRGIMQTRIQKFHSRHRFFKASEYLLITKSFPHSPQVFPQELSTGKPRCGYSFLVHIKSCDTLRPISHFFAGRGFYHGEEFVQKLGLDKACPTGWAGNRRDLVGWVMTPPCICWYIHRRLYFPQQSTNFLKKGVDFIPEKRYNVCLYGQQKQGGGICAQH